VHLSNFCVSAVAEMQLIKSVLKTLKIDQCRQQAKTQVTRDYRLSTCSSPLKLICRKISILTPTCRIRTLAHAAAAAHLAPLQFEEQKFASADLHALHHNVWCARLNLHAWCSHRTWSSSIASLQRERKSGPQELSWSSSDHNLLQATGRRYWSIIRIIWKWQLQPKSDEGWDSRWKLEIAC
jgi:hypothetical protein